MEHNYYTMHKSEADAAVLALKGYKEILELQNKLHKLMIGKLNPHLWNEVAYHVGQTEYQTERAIEWFEHFLEEWQKSREGKN